MSNLGQDVKQALQQLGEQMVKDIHWHSFQGLAMSQGSLASESRLRWRALSRAGACMHEMILTEQQRYPWKLFSCLVDPLAATHVAEDAELCPNILDSLSLQHWHRYPSTEQLNSKASLAEIEAIALLVHDNTALIERGHASNKRASRAKEQTVAQRLLDSSAERVLRRFRAMSSEWQGHLAKELWSGAWAEPPTTAKTLPAQRRHRRVRPRGGPSLNKSRLIRMARPQGSAKSRARTTSIVQSAAKAMNGTGTRKKRLGMLNRFHVWLSAHGSLGGRGHLVSKTDLARYKQAMLDSETRARYSTLARIATMGRHHGAPKRRRSRHDPLACELRRRRQNSKRACLSWDPKAQRKALQEELMSSHSQEWHRRRGLAHKAKSEAKSNRGAELEDLRAFAEEARTGGSMLPFSPELQQCLLPFPLSGGTAAFWWLPDTRIAVWPQLAKSMQRGATEIESLWQARHATFMAQTVAKIKPVSKAERRARLCWEAGRCICAPRMRHRRALRGRLDRLLSDFMGPGSRKSGVSPNRRALEDGMVILRFLPTTPDGLANPQASRWFHVPLMSLDPLRPTFLRLDAGHGQDKVCLSAAFSTQHHHPEWLTAWDALEGLDIESAWMVEFWVLAGASATSQGAVAPKSMEAIPLTCRKPSTLWAGSAKEDVPLNSASSSEETERSLSADGDGAERCSQPRKRRRQHAASGPVPTPEPNPAIVGGDPPASLAPSRLAGSTSAPAEDAGLLARIRNNRNGVPEVVRAPDGSTLRLRFTWRKASKGSEFGGVQATCYQHEAERRQKRGAGGYYKLACRKELRFQSAQDGPRVLDRLRCWIMRSRDFPDRLSHQSFLPSEVEGGDERIQEEGGSSSDSSSSTSSSSTTFAGTSVIKAKAKTPAAPAAAKAKAAAQAKAKAAKAKATAAGAAEHKAKATAAKAQPPHGLTPPRQLPLPPASSFQPPRHRPTKRRPGHSIFADPACCRIRARLCQSHLQPAPAPQRPRPKGLRPRPSLHAGLH